MDKAMVMAMIISGMLAYKGSCRCSAKELNEVEELADSILERCIPREPPPVEHPIEEPIKPVEETHDSAR